MTTKPKAGSLKTKAKAIVFILSLISFTILPIFTSSPLRTEAVTDCSPNGIAYSGTSWLGGLGVNICNYPGDDSNNYVNNVNGVSTLSGYKWECVEMVNRLYLSMGWTTSNWRGNGNTLVNNVPSGLTKENNGSVSYIDTGDVITLDDGGNGHAAIINSTSGSTLNIISQNATLNSTATLASGSLSGGNASYNSSWYGYTVQAIVHHPVTSSSTTGRIVILSSGNVYAKDGLTDNWVTEWSYGTATKLYASGNRLGFQENTGHLWVKDGLWGSWYDEYSPAPTEVALTSTRLVVLSGGNVYAKDGLGDAWTTEWSYGTAAHIYASGDRIAILETNGHLWAKTGLTGSWVDELTGVSEAALNSTKLIARGTGYVYAKNNLSDSWTTVWPYNTATKLYAAGDRFGFLENTTHLWMKDGLGGSWVDEYTNPSEAAVTSTRLIIRVGGYVYAKDGLSTSWTTEWSYNTSTTLYASYNRFGFLENTGHLWLKDGLTGTLVDEYSSVDEAALS